MRAETGHPFTAGTEVLVQENYSHYGAGTFRADTVLKVHKTGRFTLASEAKRQWSAQQSNWEEDKPWFAYPTERQHGYSIYSTRLRLSDLVAKAEMEKAQVERDHKKRCDEIAKLFQSPAKVSAELSQTVMAAVAAAKS